MSIGSISSGDSMSAYAMAKMSPMEMLKAQMQQPARELIVNKASDSDFIKWVKSENSAGGKGQVVDIEV